MFGAILIVILTGFLVRADGWATDNRKLKPFTDFFNAWPCGGLFALMCLLVTDWYVAFACGLAFVVWRAPGFDGWEDWLNMFWRGWWTSALGFGLISTLMYRHPSFGLLSVPFSVIYMTIYAGGYKWLPKTIAGFDRHIWIEHASGWVFGIFVLLIISGAVYAS